MLDLKYVRLLHSISKFPTRLVYDPTIRDDILYIGGIRVLAPGVELIQDFTRPNVVGKEYVNLDGTSKLLIATRPIPAMVDLQVSPDGFKVLDAWKELTGDQLEVLTTIADKRVRSQYSPEAFDDLVMIDGQPASKEFSEKLDNFFEDQYVTRVPPVSRHKYISVRAKNASEMVYSLNKKGQRLVDLYRISLL